MRRSLLPFLIAAALDGQHFVPENPSIASAPDPLPPAGGGPDPAKPPVVLPAVPPVAPPVTKEPYAVFETEASMMERVGRLTKKQLKELGFTDEEHAKKVLEEHGKQVTAAAEAERAKMTEIERLRADIASRDKVISERDATIVEVMGAREQAELRAHLNEVFVEKSIRNAAYAFHLVTTKLASLKDDESLDERAFLDEMAKDPAQAAALGIAAPIPPEAKPGGVTTSPRPPGAPPPPPPAVNPGQKPFDFRTASPTEMAAYKRQHGI